MHRPLTIVAVFGVAGTALAGEITKPPDQGPFWYPLGPDGTYVYANSFVADVSGPVDELGTWLLAQDGPGNGPDVRFEVWGSIGDDPANGPDAGSVLAGTGSLSFGGTDTLDFYAAPAQFSESLDAGEVYWFVATCVGEAGEPFDWQTGGHTQNSVYQDDGTFWYSNDPNGIDFDGQGLTPEMAFSLTIVPAPGALAPIGLAGLACVCRRR